jgi:hypothetical protein
MGMQQHINFESGLLRVQGSGDFSLENATQAFLNMLQALVHHKAEKILFDGRNITGQPEQIERFYYGDFAAKETLKIVGEHGYNPRFAYVLHEPVLDPDKLGETVAQNRGMNVKVFKTLEDAIRWLTN